MERLTALVVWGVILIGVAGIVVALRGRGGQEVFLSQQPSSLSSTAATGR